MGRPRMNDRGLYLKLWHGEKMWYVRCSVNGEMKRFGPFPAKTVAREMYMKVKGRCTTGLPVDTDEVPPSMQVASRSASTEYGECIYFLQAGPGGLVKIGHSKQLAARLKTLHTMNGGTLALLGTMKGTQTDERYLHDKYAADRSHGEWFRLSPAIVSFLCGAGMNPSIAPKANAN